MHYGPLQIDLGRRQAQVNGFNAPLTRIEFDLLAHLCQRPRDVSTRLELLRSIWGENWVGDDHVVDVHLSNLRRKLHHFAPETSFIATVRGVGFRLSDELLRAPEPAPVVIAPIAEAPVAVAPVVDDAPTLFPDFPEFPEHD